MIELNAVFWDTRVSFFMDNVLELSLPAKPIEYFNTIID